MPGVGLYLGVVQFFFAASWIVYVLYLPQLAAQAGIGKAAVAWILMADQLVFVFADYASGVAADRVSRAVGRIGGWVLAATLVSCAAFLALPFVAPGASPAIFLALTLIWAVTSSALRAPPLSLLGKHVAKPKQPLLLALSLLGLGVANAISPYLGLQLRGIDPRIPFVLSSVALALVTLGLVAVERKLRARARVPASPAADAAKAAAPTRAAPDRRRWSSPRPCSPRSPSRCMSSSTARRSICAWRRRSRCRLLSPVFWIGFNLGLLPLSLAAKRWPPARVMGAAALVAAAAAGAATIAPTLPTADRHADRRRRRLGRRHRRRVRLGAGARRRRPGGRVRRRHLVGAGAGDAAAHGQRQRRLAEGAGLQRCPGLVAAGRLAAWPAW